jgi:hypothetical protein
MPFAPTKVKIGPGTLYAAPIGTTEPTGVTGAWAPSWTPIGYTTKGSTFEFTPTLGAVEVEEEIWPIRHVVTKYTAKLTFVMAESTQRNLVLALNGGIGTLANPTMKGVTGGSVWVEPPSPGTERRIMLGWDSQPKATATPTNVYGRLVCRQAIQDGPLKVTHQKGTNKSVYSVSFVLEKPTTKQPFRMWLSSTLVS